MARAATAVTVVPFTQKAEPLSGADWIWWWVDRSSAYGMLVQAKRLTIERRRWSFGFDYRPSGSVRTQREILIETAAALDLLPVHALYLGTGDYRHWEHCSDNHWKSRCPECMRRTISLMPALLASDLIVDDAKSTYEWSVALEDLWIPPRTAAVLIPALERAMPPDLLDFLTARPDGTRAVVRSMIDRVLRSRAGMFSPVSTSPNASITGSHDQLGPIFREMPDDSVHGGVQYLEHVLGPLKPTPPGYVVQVIAGDVDVQQLRNEMPSTVAGVVVVDTPRRGDG